MRRSQRGLLLAAYAVGSLYLPGFCGNPEGRRRRNVVGMAVGADQAIADADRRR